jgi:SAM-dependent methyltransferase
MLAERLWAVARPFVPLQLYPVLAPAHRWRRRIELKRLNADDRRYLRAHPRLVVPPVELRYNVGAPGTIQQFLESGERTVDDIETALKSVGRSLSQSREFLDFGCGCGRLILALRNRSPNLKVTGCDVDKRAISWCERHLTHGTWHTEEYVRKHWASMLETRGHLPRGGGDYQDIVVAQKRG